VHGCDVGAIVNERRFLRFRFALAVYIRGPSIREFFISKAMGLFRAIVEIEIFARINVE
jgi:hypothetical protein